MVSSTLFPLLLLFLAACGKKPDDDTQIRKLIEDFAHAENQRNATQLTGLFAPDGDIYIQNKRLASGTKQISASLLPRIPWSEIGPATYRVETVRKLDPHFAIVDTDRTYFTPVMKRSTFATFVLERTHDGWRIASYRNVLPGPPLSTDSTFERGKEPGAK